MDNPSNLSNEERAIAISKKLREIAVLASGTGENANMFSDIGPSESFLAVHLSPSEVSQDDVTRMVDKIDEAVADGNLNLANKIAGSAVTVLKTVKDILL